MRTLTLSVVLLALVGCHGIEPTPTSPAPTARSNAAAKLAIVISPGELPIGGGSAVVRVEALGLDGFGVATAVALTASAGTLATDSVMTDSTGHATAAWSGTKTATIRGMAGELAASSTVPVREPTVFPPNPTPPPLPVPTPTPIPTPAPTPPPLSVSLMAFPDRVQVGYVLNVTATAAHLNPDESVMAYQWNWEWDGKTTTTFAETSISDSRSHIYSADGIKPIRVQILTSSGRTVSGTLNVVVYKG